MSNATWANLIDALGTVALVASALVYLAWDRWIDHLEGQTPEKGRFDDEWR